MTMIDVWFLRYGTQQTEFFVTLDQHLENMKKMSGYIIIFTSVSKIMIIGCTGPEIWHMTDIIIILHFGLFLTLLLH